MITRRIFGKMGLGLGAATALASMLVTTACNTFDNILKYVNVGLQAFQSIVDLLTGAGVIPPGEGTLIDLAIALVKSGFADVQTAVNDYDSAPADQKSSLKLKIALALSILEANIQSFWSDLKIPDVKLASLVQGLIGIILSTLGAFSATLPTPPANVKAENAKALAHRITVSPKARTVHEFKSDFNKLLVTNGYTQYSIK